MSSKKQTREKKNYFIAFRVDQATRLQLEARVREFGVPVAQIVRWAVAEYLEKTGTNHRGA